MVGGDVVGLDRDQHWDRLGEFGRLGLKMEEMEEASKKRDEKMPLKKPLNAELKALEIGLVVLLVGELEGRKRFQ